MLIVTSYIFICNQYIVLTNSLTPAALMGCFTVIFYYIEQAMGVAQHHDAVS